MELSDFPLHDNRFYRHEQTKSINSVLLTNNLIKSAVVILLTKTISQNQKSQIYKYLYEKKKDTILKSNCCISQAYTL